MNSSRRVVLIVLLVAALSTVAVSPAAAAPASQGTGPNLPALSCESGTCELTGSASGLLGILRDAHLSFKQLPAQGMTEGGSQATLDLQKDVTLSLPVGEITLTNARLQLELGADGKIRRLNGSADMPFPTFGLLDNVAVVAPARASVGLDLGKNLPDTGFEPVPDRPYLFFSANTFMNLTGRTPGQQNDFSLAVAPGQRLTLVVDTVEPVAYLNGHVTLSITDQIALLGGILESTPLGPYVPDTLPLRERTQYGLSGKFSKDLAKSQLTLRGAYLLDAGFLPAQLGVDARLVDVLGELTLTRNGALVDGVLKSSIQPDKVFDSRVEVKTFIPFDEAAGPGYASVDAMAKAPAVRLGVGGGATASAGRYELTGRLSTPFTRSDLKGQLSGNLPDVGGTVGPAVANAAGAVGTAAGKAAGAVALAASKAAGGVGTAAGNAAAFVGPLASNVAGAVAGYARSGVSLAHDAVKVGGAQPALQPAVEPGM